MQRQREYLARVAPISGLGLDLVVTGDLCKMGLLDFAFRGNSLIGNLSAAINGAVLTAVRVLGMPRLTVT